ncbi:MAG: SRPBCC family protein [Chloroflexi bacterium]|nr:SRPBCC family protein [Chloroflexota bacterium]
MATIEHSIGILASPAQVWARLTDIQGQPDWMTGIRSLEITSETTRGLHTTFRVVSRGPFGTRVVDDMEYTEWVEEQALVVEHRGSVKGHGTFLLTPIELGTRLGWREEIRMPLGLLGELVFRLLYRRALRRTFKQDLWNLKRLVEEKADTTAQES